MYEDMRLSILQYDDRDLRKRELRKLRLVSGWTPTEYVHILFICSCEGGKNRYPVRRILKSLTRRSNEIIYCLILYFCWIRFNPQHAIVRYLLL